MRINRLKDRLRRNRRKLTQSLHQNPYQDRHPILYLFLRFAFSPIRGMSLPLNHLPSSSLPSVVHGRIPWLIVGLLGWLSVGCSPSRMLGRQMMKAPNSYPEWVAPDALVTFALPEAIVRAFPARSVAVGPPSAHLSYRVIEPADYQLQEHHTTELKHGKTYYHFRYQGVPAPFAEWYPGPVRGTLLILHGYSVEAETMLPWAFKLGADGWRSVVPDLRGHGQSSGTKVYFGAVENRDLSQLLDELERERVLVSPVVVVGTSFGAALGLKLATEDTRIAGVVAITPYGRLETAIMGIRDGYASWVPKGWVRAAARRLPELTGVEPGQLDPVQWVQRKPVRAWLAAGTGDTIAPMYEVQELRPFLAPGSDYFQTTNGIHETIPLQIEELSPAVRRWLESIR